MVANLLFLFGAVFVFSSVLLLTFHHERRTDVLKRFCSKRWKGSRSKTPPRSLSPEKQNVYHAPTPDYSSTFPPSRRSVISTLEVPLQPHTRCMLPMALSHHNAAGDMLTPCGFSIAEIKALGDFPDYASLSGVPLPKPYHEFDVCRALPRPYRPFRWAYHQTMCKLNRFWSLRANLLAAQHFPRWTPIGGWNSKTPMKSE